MPYRRDRKKYFYLFFVFVLIIIFHYIGWLAPLERGLRALAIAPFGSWHTVSVNLGDNYEVFKNQEEFISAYRVCREKTVENLAAGAELTLLKKENEELRAFLNYREKSQRTLVVARVIGKELLTTDQTILINQGSSSGVAVGDPVLAGAGILVGKIITTEPDLSVVRLINDNQSRVSAAILNRDESLGVVEGGYGLSLRMNLIPRDEIVRVGDQVLTGGLETGMPWGLLIGTVAVIENEPYKPFQQAVLTPITDLAKLTLVSVAIQN